MDLLSISPMWKRIIVAAIGIFIILLFWLIETFSPNNRTFLRELPCSFRAFVELNQKLVPTRYSLGRRLHRWFCHFVNHSLFQEKSFWIFFARRMTEVIKWIFTNKTHFYQKKTFYKKTFYKNTLDKKIFLQKDYFTKNIFLKISNKIQK